MMLPLRDHNPATTKPYVTWALIALNVIVFFSYADQFAQDRALSRLFFDWGIVPLRLTQGSGFAALVTSQFLHAGLLHLGGNMLFLWIFGDNLEDALGRVGFLTFYLVCGIGAGLMQVVAAPYSTAPVIGASGAIAGVMGGYLLLFPKAGIDILIFLVVIVRIVTVPAWVMLGLWFGFQLLNGASDSGSGGVAYWAHSGGFVVGMALCLPVWLRRGGRAGWVRTAGRPPHPEARYRLTRTTIPSVPRNRAGRGR